MTREAVKKTNPSCHSRESGNPDLIFVCMHQDGRYFRHPDAKQSVIPAIFKRESSFSFLGILILFAMR
jgi:hypothetical protein